jgi:hypothetical protein
MIGLAEFLQEVLGILRDVKLHPQGEECGSDHHELVERGVLAIIKTPKKGINITSINKGVPDEGRDHQEVGVRGDRFEVKRT